MNSNRTSQERKINFFFLLRVCLGILFVVSGTEKLVGPYQNFLYVVQSYKVLPDLLEEPVARFFPWLELFVGMFVLLGLWLKSALVGATALLTTFIIVVGQAIGRQLPITECGCFGGLISFPLPVVLLLDSILLFLSGFLLYKLNRTSSLSLDGHFQKK